MRYNVIYLLSALAVALISCEKPGNGDKQGNDTDALPVKEDYLQAKSPKKGVSFDFGRFPVEDVQLLGPAISWSYNWAIDTQIKAQEEFRKKHTVKVPTASAVTRMLVRYPPGMYSLPWVLLRFALQIQNIILILLYLKKLQSSLIPSITTVKPAKIS